MGAPIVSLAMIYFALHADDPETPLPCDDRNIPGLDEMIEMVDMEIQARCGEE